MRLITKGYTRVVILTENYAFKVALIGPMSLCLLILKSAWRGEILLKFRRHKGKVGQLVKGVVARSGLEANRNEIRISREHPEYPVAPVLRHYLWGFVIVMPRGEPIDESLEPWGSPFSLPAHLQSSDLFRSHSTCRFKDGLRIVDYACPYADKILPLFLRRQPGPAHTACGARLSCGRNFF